MTCKCGYNDPSEYEEPSDPNAARAWRELAEAGFYLLGHELGWGGHFALSAEACCENMPRVTADYWDEHGHHWKWSINPEVTLILDKYGLYAEWVNPGVLSVHDA